MRIALVSSAVPHVLGGARFIVDWLAVILQEHGHTVTTTYLSSDLESQSLYRNMLAFRLLDLSDRADRVVTFRPPAHVIRHPHKIVWFLHHERGFYDLWGTPFFGVPDTFGWRAFRQSLINIDTAALSEASRLYTNSRVVGERIRRFNRLSSEVLYPPVLRPERFRTERYGDEIVAVGRLESHKRQHLLLEAMRYVRSPVRLRVHGASMDANYVALLLDTVRRLGCEDRVAIEPRWISESEKVVCLATALAVAYPAFDEDSYGYPVIEAAHARKAAIVASDGGGVREFVVHNETGLIEPPEPKALAEAFDRLWSDKQFAERMGEAAAARVDELGICWPRVLRAILE